MVSANSTLLIIRQLVDILVLEMLILHARGTIPVWKVVWEHALGLVAHWSQSEDVLQVTMPVQPMPILIVAEASDNYY